MQQAHKKPQSLEEYKAMIAEARRRQLTKIAQYKIGIAGKKKAVRPGT